MPEQPVTQHPEDGGAQPAIDAATLAQLNQLDPQGTSGIVQRVLETYLRSLDKLMGECTAARLVADWPAVGRLAHTLRSSSASVGALLLSQHCKTVETMIREGRLDGLEPAVEALQIESVRVRAAIAAMLRPQGTPT